ncbi:MAG TPA: hypothetical protein DGF25_08565 [Catenibacterium sp.]|nr:hypothetical protein [Catenibacterium sp.]
MNIYKIPLLFIILSSIFAYINKLTFIIPELNYLIIIFQGLLISSVLALFISISYAIKKTFEFTEENIQIDTMMKNQELRKKQEEELKAIKENAEDIENKIKKDLKTVSEMLDTNVEDAKETLMQLSDHFESVRMHPICADSLMNAILQSKREYANTLGIDVHYHVMTEYANKFDTDLSAVLFNLLDNGIEACSQCNDSSLSLSISDHMGYLHIKMVNSKQEKKFTGETTKEDKVHHGYGLSIITDIANKHDGSVQWIDNGDTFTSLVMLKV